MRRDISLKILILVTLLGISLLLGLFIGARSISLAKVFAALTSYNPNDSDQSVIWDSRAPRTLAAIFAGGLVAISGGLLQGVTRNNLADPGIMGLTANASLFVVVAASFGLTSNLFITIASFIGTLFGTTFLALLSLNRKVSHIQVVVAGVAVAAGISSIASFVLIIKPSVADAFRHWMLGSLVGTTWRDIYILAPSMIVVIALSLPLIKALNVMALGDEQSRALGISITRYSAAVYTVAALAAGLATAFVGPIMFIGLLAPHTARLIVGHDQRFALPSAALMGGLLLIWADVIGRVIMPPGELDAGIVVSVLGAPLVLVILRRYFK